MNLHALLLAAIRLSTPLLFAAMGGALTYQAGMLNIALDGFMIVAAFFGVATAAATGSLALAVIAAVVSAILLAALLATFNLRLNADIFIAGIAVTFLSYGLTGLLLKNLLGQEGVFAPPAIPRFTPIRLPLVEEIPLLGSLLSGQTILVYAAFLSVPVVAWSLYRTRWGLRVRMVGAAPDAAEAAGIRVGRIKAQTMLLSGLFCGLGGVYLSLGYLSLFAREMTGERGLIALAAIFFARGRPFRTAAAVLMFGCMSALAVELPQVTTIAPELLQLVPYLAAVAALGVIGARNVRGRDRHAAWRFEIE